MCPTVGLNAAITVNQPMTATVSLTNPMASINLMATGAINVGGAFTANRVNVTSGVNTNINVNATIAGSGTNPVIALSAFGAGNITQGVTGMLGDGSAGTSLVFRSSTGSFGTATNRLLTNVDTLSFSSFGGSNAFFTETNGVTTGLSNFIGNDLDLRANGNTVLNGVFAGRHITIDVQTGGTLTQNMGTVLQSIGGGIALTTANNAANTMTFNGLILTGGNNALSAININSGGNVTLGFMNSFGPTQGNITVNSQQGSVDIAPNQSVLASIGNVGFTSNTGQNLNGFIRTLQSGSITLSARGAITTRGLATGALGPLPNNITVNIPTGSPAGSGFTLQPGFILTTGNNGNIDINTNSVVEGHINLTGGLVIQNQVGSLTLNVSGVGSGIRFGLLTQVAEGNITARFTGVANGPTVPTIQLQQFGTIVSNAILPGNGNILITPSGNGPVTLEGSVRTNVRGRIDVITGGVGAITVFNLATGSLGGPGDNNLSVTNLGGTGSITVLPNAVLSTGNNGNINIATGSTNNGDILIGGSIFTFGASNSAVSINARRSLTINRPIFSAAGTVTLSTANGDLITGSNAQISAGGAVTLTTNLGGPVLSPSANIILNSGLQKFTNAGAVTVQ